jgi:hypothetical protein
MTSLNRSDHRTAPDRTDPRTARREARWRVDFSDAVAIREMRADLRVAEQELREAVHAVGDDWLVVRTYIQERATRVTDRHLTGPAKAGPGHPGQHGQKDADQTTQNEQFAAGSPDPAK